MRDCGDSIHRNVIIDRFRGLALIIILIDHVESVNSVHFLKQWTPVSLGWSDAAEGFVFLSGYTFGMVYNDRLNSRGGTAALLSAASRSLQIYSAYLLSLTVVLGIAFLLSGVYPDYVQLANLNELPFRHLAGALCFSNHPTAFSILSFYIVMLPFAVLLLVVSRRSLLMACSISLVLYGLASANPAFNFPTVVPRGGRWGFNPFCWQLLFFVSLVLGAKNGEYAKRKLLPGTATAISVLVVIASLLIKCGFDTGVLGPFGNMLHNHSWLSSKTNLGPLRLAHFFCVAWLLYCISSKWCAAPLASVFYTIEQWGQSSLPIFCIGLILTYLSLAVVRQCGISFLATIMVHVFCIVFCSWIAEYHLKDG